MCEKQTFENLVREYYDNLRLKIDTQIDFLLDRSDELQLNKERIMLHREKLNKIIHDSRDAIMLKNITVPENYKDKESILSYVFKDHYLIYLDNPYEDDSIGKLILIKQYIPKRIIDLINDLICSLKNTGKFMLDILDQDKLQAFNILKQLDPLINHYPSKANRQDVWLTSDLTTISHLEDVSLCDKLDLKKTQITSISKEIFSNFSNLHTLNLSENFLTILDKNLFKGLTNLKILNLEYNNLSHLDDDLFGDLPRLNLLNLHNNKLVLLNDENFTSLANLLYLDFSNNSIQSIHENCFDSLSNLIELNMRKNEIDLIDKNWFKNLKNLQVLNLSHNFLISRLESNNFANLTNLKKLNLAKVVFDSISTESFKGLNKLEDLVLSECDLENKLSEYLFKDLTNLRLLSLDKNKISKLEPIFHDLKNLEALGLSCNNLEYLPENFFQGLTKLKQVNLGFNKISKCYSKWFKEDLNLERIYLNNNLIESLNDDEMFSYLPKLEILDISGNHIKQINESVFQGLFNAQIIYDVELSLDSVIKDYKTRGIDLKPEVSIRIIEE
ncbi:unnamed protein product [Brachionus calyciflorus]|uniref:Uncharacterized protein n=1 Tax=Brachionus calyciflorus TaxID=104777 RepID=A0A814EJX8_9BILA|nr:unnamed protein product [Brachionus calyciflorus]